MSNKHNAERERLTEKLIEDFGVGRVFAAAGLVLRNTRDKKLPDEACCYSGDEIGVFIQQLNIKQLGLLRKVVQGVKFDGVESRH